MYKDGVTLTQSIQELHDLNDITPVIKAELAFKVVQGFEDPYLPYGKGYALRSYPHERDQNRSVFICHVSLRDASVPHTKTRMDYTHLDVVDDDDDYRTGGTNMQEEEEDDDNFLY